MDKSLPIDIQLFAEPAAPEKSAAGNAPEIDYEKLAGIINGAQAAKEDAVLKNYFKQQGLSAEEASQAITSFKEMKAKNQPDLTALQDQATQAQAAAQQAQAAAQQAMLERDATLEALSLGVDAKTIPYVLKLADFSQALGEDGITKPEALQEALKKVLEDVPALKPNPQQQSGFRQIGASGNGQQGSVESALDKIFGTSKK